MNKKLLFYLIGGLSVILAGTAAFFSIAGLSKLFAGAAIAVMIMASALEVSKLIIASFLYQYWQTLAVTLKSYLLIATVIIMTITSIGIYGFLSAAYQETKSVYDLSATFTDSLNSKKVYYETYVATYEKQIDQQNNRLAQLNEIRNSQENRLNTQIGSSYQTDKSSRLTDKQINEVTVSIDKLNTILLQYTDSINKLTIAATQSKLKNNLTSDLGPLQFISATFNVNMDSVVNVLIILFITVFDPLAICLVLAYNFMKLKNDSDAELPIEPKISTSNEFVDLPVEMNQTNLVESVNEQETPVKPLEEQLPKQNKSTIVVESMDLMSPEPLNEDTVITIDEVRSQKAEKAQQLYSGGISV